MESISNNNAVPLLAFSQVTKRYSSVTALNGLDLKIGGGKIVGLLGANGSGKTTMLKLAAGLLTATAGEVKIGGLIAGVETKKLVSFLPERPYYSSWMKVSDLQDIMADFYSDYDRVKANEMLTRLGLAPAVKIKTLSKGNIEKVHLIMTMSRSAKLYLLDEPIAGVDPATRDYILDTIISNYSESASVIISTHLILDIERILDEVIFIGGGKVFLHDSTDHIREEKGKSVDELFREVFRCY